MSAKMPLDDNNNPLPILGYPDGKGAHTLAASDISARTTVIFDKDTKVVSIHALVPIFFRFGLATVNATVNDHTLPAGYHDIPINHHLAAGEDPKVTHLAVLRMSSNGAVYASERE